LIKKEETKENIKNIIKVARSTKDKNLVTKLLTLRLFLEAIQLKKQRI
jgi:hypothetical protein